MTTRKTSKQVSVTDAVKTGDRITSLIAMRDKLAADMDDKETPARDRATIAKQLQAIIDAIDGQEDKSGGTALGDIEERRRARQAS